jgi:hypothetical protein
VAFGTVGDDSSRWLRGGHHRHPPVPRRQAGIGRLTAGMARLQYDLQLTRYGQEGWRATFYPAGIAHSLTPMVGSAWARAPWARAPLTLGDRAA